MREMGASEICEIEEWFARRAIGAGKQVVNLSADHEVDDVGYGGVGDQAAARAFPISQNCELIGDFFDFFEEMRDIDDCQISRFQALYHAKQAVDICAREAAGGFVEDEDAALNR